MASLSPSSRMGKPLGCVAPFEPLRLPAIDTHLTLNTGKWIVSTERAGHAGSQGAGTELARDLCGFMRTRHCTWETHAIPQRDQIEIVVSIYI